MRTAAFICLFVMPFLFSQLYAEAAAERDARAVVDNPRPALGQPVTLTVKVMCLQSDTVRLPPFGTELQQFAIEDFGSSEEKAPGSIALHTYWYKLKPPIPGSYIIEPFEISVIDERGVLHNMRTQRVFIETVQRSGAAEEEEIRGPKPQASVYIDMRKGITAVLVFAVLCGAGWWIYTHRGMFKKNTVPCAEAPHQKVLERLQRAARMPLSTQEQIKSYYTEISDAVRVYIEERFQIMAPELTTEEFLEAVSVNSSFTHRHRALLRGFLTDCDLVKFANSRPSRNQADMIIEDAKTFVLETKQEVPSVKI